MTIENSCNSTNFWKLKLQWFWLRMEYHTSTNFSLKSRLANLWVNSNSSLRYSQIWAYFASFHAISDLKTKETSIWYQIQSKQSVPYQENYCTCKTRCCLAMNSRNVKQKLSIIPRKTCLKIIIIIMVRGSPCAYLIYVICICNIPLRHQIPDNSIYQNIKYQITPSTKTSKTNWLYSIHQGLGIHEEITYFFATAWTYTPSLVCTPFIVQ